MASKQCFGLAAYAQVRNKFQCHWRRHGFANSLTRRKQGREIVLSNLLSPPRSTQRHLQVICDDMQYQQYAIIPVQVWVVQSLQRQLKLIGSSWVKWTQAFRREKQILHSSLIARIVAEGCKCRNLTECEFLEICVKATTHRLHSSMLAKHGLPLCSPSMICQAWWEKKPWSS